MPFADERSQVAVVEYRSQWPAEFELLAGGLRDVLGDLASGIDHVGSTSVPGLPAKDCIDAQVRMSSIDEARDVPMLAAAGFRCRPEPWNRIEVSGGRRCHKLVFAPPIDACSCNIHLREGTGPNARFALLFRDYLRADEAACRAWGAFKQQLALRVPDLSEYGQIKAPATDVLMGVAERWAAETGWKAVGEA
ncbi:GrpB family protein [Streptomyces sp. NPDC058221]|uniref:GrpB family protein n=1 Tax=Streptomyces sp. NPDC058221 TaxID=3346388 RepID=UPI0036E8540F